MDISMIFNGLWTSVIIKVEFNIYSFVFLMMIFHWKLVAFFILAPTATIGRCGDFCGTGSMYYLVLHPFFDVSKASEYVCDRFRAPKDNERHLHSNPDSLGAVQPVLTHAQPQPTTGPSSTEGFGIAARFAWLRVPESLKWLEINR